MIKLIEVKERWRVSWLLFLAKCVAQGNRVLLGALMPSIAEELKLGAVEKGNVLASFAFGYMFTQVLGGYAADRVGGKGLIQIAITAMALGVWCASRVSDYMDPATGLGGVFFVMGFCEGPSFATTNQMLSRWIPSHERSKAVSIVDTGSSLGAMLTFGVAPAVGHLIGWRATLAYWGYGSGVICILWALGASNGPDDCPGISRGELEYLQSHGLGKKRHEKDQPHSRFPWRLFAYRSVWATCAAHAAFNFGRYFVYNSLLAFYVETFKVSDVAAGQHIFVGQIFDAVGKFAFAPFADRAIRRKPAARTTVRRIVSGGAFAAFALSMAGFAWCGSVGAATSWLILAKMASSVHVCGFKSNFLDQTAQHTGSFSGVSNTFATLAAAVSPLVGGRLLDGTRGGWRAMFLCIGAINLAALAFWVTSASGESLDDKLNAAAQRDLEHSPRSVDAVDADAVLLDKQKTLSPTDIKRKKITKV